jgi:hypothetical protein
MMPTDQWSALKTLEQRRDYLQAENPLVASASKSSNPLELLTNELAQAEKGRVRLPRQNPQNCLDVGRERR